MNFPLVLADALPLNEGSPVSISLAVMVGGSIVVLAVGLAESRFKVAAQERRSDAQDVALAKIEETWRRTLEDAKRDSEKDRNEIRQKVQVVEVGQAKAEVLMTEVRTQLAQQAEASREHTRLLHELLNRSETPRRRASDAA